MKGLLIKDTYTIFKQMKIFLLMIVIFAFIPGLSAMSFSIVFATLLPISAVAYEERSKWNVLAAMMPYTATEQVVEKYLFGYAVIIAAVALDCGAQALASLFTQNPLTGEYFSSLVLLVCGGLMVDAVEMPVVLRFGVEKGRMYIILFAVVIAMTAAALISNISDLMAQMNLAAGPVILLALLAAAVFNAVSIPLSIKWQARKR